MNRSLAKTTCNISGVLEKHAPMFFFFIGRIFQHCLDICLHRPHLPSYYSVTKELAVSFCLLHLLGFNLKPVSSTLASRCFTSNDSIKNNCHQYRLLSMLPYLPEFHSLASEIQIGTLRYSHLPCGVMNAVLGMNLHVPQLGDTL